MQVITQSNKSAQLVLNEFGVSSTSDFNELNKEADLYLIAVPDDNIPEIANRLKLGSALLVHTSGSVSMDVLKSATENFGIFYPLQSFSRNKDTEFTKIPICIESNKEENSILLEQLASRISDNIHRLNSDQRKIVHIAAVFANNFVNHMYSSAAKILKERDISFDILLPLIRETANKVFEENPDNTQTGPAQRKDIGIINEHLDYLKRHHELRNIYQIITDDIMNKLKGDSYA